MDAPVRTVKVHHNLIDGQSPNTGNGWTLMTVYLDRPRDLDDLAALLKFVHDAIWACIQVDHNAQKNLLVCLKVAGSGDIVVDQAVGINPPIGSGQQVEAIIVAARSDVGLGLVHPMVCQVMEMAGQSGWSVETYQPCELVELEEFDLRPVEVEAGDHRDGGRWMYE